MTPLRWLITGGDGMVASDLREELTSQGEDVVALSRRELDITEQSSVSAAVRSTIPSIIINCAAYTRVDAAESDESLATAVNGSAVEVLASEATRAGALLVQLSTDFVFDGTARTPYDIHDATNPLSAYGRSKLIGEFAASHAEKHLVLRTSWLFGRRGPNFVQAIRNQIAKGTNPLRVVRDQRGRPTYTGHLAHAVIRLARLSHASPDARGIVQYADSEACSWFDFATAIVEELGAGTEVVPVTTAEFPRPAPRPSYSVLSTERYERITGAKPESWRDGLREYLS